MRDKASVVVIGGGIFGTSVAYHLARAGVKDLVLLEKGELTSGTTFHSVGLVSQFRSSPALMQIMNYTISLFDELQEEAGDALGWQRYGSLRLASSEDRLLALKRDASRAAAIGLEVDIVSPERVLELFPYLSPENLFGAVHIPDDGYIDPNGITNELARQARRLGAEVVTGVRVTGIELSPAGAVTGVNTDQGAIQTECVVNAAGQWAPRICEMVGARLPMVPLMHQYLTTKPIPGRELPKELPVVRDPDNLFYVRPEVGGFLVGIFETEPKAWSVQGVPWEFSQQLLNPEWELVESALEQAFNRVPLLAEAEIIELINGPDAFTPDGHYALGPVPGVKGFFVAAGGSINGIAGAGGVGKILAEWILEGQPSIDTHEMDVRRFGPHLDDLDYLTEKAREVYRYYYHLHYPLDENQWGRPLRKSPFYGFLEQAGAVFGEKNGWERVNYFEPGRPGRRAGAEQRAWGFHTPPYFQHIEREARATREKVALFDMSSFGKLEVSGPGALEFLQGMAAGNLDRPQGRLVYTQLLNRGGGIECDLTVTRLGEQRFRLITGTSFAASDLGWLRLHLPEDGSVELRDLSEELGCLGLWGPRARDVLQKVSPDDLSNQAFPYLSARHIEVGGASVLAQRVSYAGELGWELYVIPADAPRVWEAVVEAGREFGMELAGYKALDSLRLEKGYLYWGGDITPVDNLLEAGLGALVAWDKGDFLGRDALLELRERGLSRRMRALLVDCEPYTLYGGEAVLDQGRVVARVRSGGYGFTVGSNIALAYLPLELARPGTELEVEVLGRRVPARVAATPLVDPKGEKLRA